MPSRNPLLLSAWWLLLALPGCGGADTPADPGSGAGTLSDGPAAPERERPKVAIFGIDGATFRVMLPLLDAGRLPHMAALIERGTGLVMKKPSKYDASPVLWTSLMTGTMPECHGITNFGIKEGGELRVFASTDREMPALWTLVDAQRGTCGIVGIWNTWPAEIVDGYVVSDRFCHTLFETQWGQAGVDFSKTGIVYPHELTAEVQPFARAPDDVSREDVSMLGGFTDAEWAEVMEGDKRGGTTQGNGLVSLKFGWQAQESVAGASLHLLRTREQPDLFATFFELPDRVSHHFWHAYEPDNVAGGRAAVEPEWLERWAEIVPRSYERVDWWMGQMLAELDEDTTVFVVSDHGFQTSRGVGGTLDDLSSIHHSGTHHDDGIFLAAGPAIVTGAQAKVHLLDVAPMVMVALGLPMADHFKGRLKRELIDRDFLGRHPLQEPLDYDPLIDRRMSERAGQLSADMDGVDDQFIQHLIQLGYTGGNGQLLQDQKDEAGEGDEAGEKRDGC